MAERVAAKQTAVVERNRAQRFAVKFCERVAFRRPLRTRRDGRRRCAARCRGAPSICELGAANHSPLSQPLAFDQAGSAMERGSCQRSSKRNGRAGSEVSGRSACRSQAVRTRGVCSPRFRCAGGGNVRGLAAARLVILEAFAASPTWPAQFAKLAPIARSPDRRPLRARTASASRNRRAPPRWMRNRRKRKPRGRAPSRKLWRRPRA